MLAESIARKRDRVRRKEARLTSETTLAMLLTARAVNLSYRLKFNSLLFKLLVLCRRSPARTLMPAVWKWGCISSAAGMNLSMASMLSETVSSLDVSASKAESMSLSSAVAPRVQPLRAVSREQNARGA